MPLPDVQFDPAERTWHAWFACSACGGYRHDLPVSDPGARDAALAHRERAAAEHDAGCLACRSAQARRGRGERSHGRLWWDSGMREWLLEMTPSGIPAGVLLPTGVRWAASVTQADIAARLMMGAGPLRLGVLEDGRAPDPDRHLLLRDRDGRFGLRVSCPACGGASVTLAAQDGWEAAARDALECLGWVAADGCPQCRARRARADELALGVWWDEAHADWMCRYAPAGANPVLAPLRIGRYGASQQQVRAAVRALLAGAHGRPR